MNGRMEKIRERFYWTCPECGANLDPGERCDCEEKDRQDNSSVVITSVMEAHKQLNYITD